jgi:nucleoside-diphosphate-sugar epimerase
MVEGVSKAMDVAAPRLRAPFWPFALLATVMELTLRPFGIQPPLHRRRLDFFRKSFELSTEKAGRAFGFSPQVSFEEGARLTAEWYRDRGLL